MPKLLVFSGSIRRASLNRVLASALADAARSSGADVTLLDLADHPLPLYNGDLEEDEGLPPAVPGLKQLFRESDALVIASPEYNSAFSPLLKNTIDWCSRAESDDEPPLDAFRGKTALLAAASPSPLGGLRGLYALRDLMQNIGVTVHPDLLAVRSAHEVVDEDGRITDGKWSEKIRAAAAGFVDFAGKFSVQG